MESLSQSKLEKAFERPQVQTRSAAPRRKQKAKLHILSTREMGHLFQAEGDICLSSSKPRGSSLESNPGELNARGFPP